MAGNLNALGLIAIMTVTIWAVFRYGRVPSIKEAMWGVVYSIGWVVMLLLVTTLFTILDFENNLAHQITITLCCIAVANLAVASQPARRRLLIFLLVAHFVLCGEFSYIVRTSYYTCNPPTINHFAEERQACEIPQIQMWFEAEMQDTPSIGDRTFPSGPMAISEIWKVIADPSLQSPRFLTMKMYTAYPCWHTWFTGIYGKHAYLVQLWYPGGKIKDGIYRLAYRR